ncbi:hypothetical protein K0T92_14315 [Paenibacillus oenotherae]|uniref:Uncharacterized protein n=1 Tax=Paenibacillus oenotherae TaxID=1435645 RepID=A0ABS7D7U8_9BACL|nr:hypothetical protein [Paenibacillus oenotherae]MBW7475916.1 hypothetical protein [Paenibacillus oenotherae]
MDKDIIEQLIGRPMNEEEAQTVEWLNGWDFSTKVNIMRLLQAAHQNGLGVTHYAFGD